jgi:DNA-directed RNA polymerase subunit RPC12/RpoP
MEDYELAEEQERQEFVRVLLDRDMLQGSAAGIARQYVDRGDRSLSERQRAVLDDAIEEHRVQACARCGSDVPWSEQIEALDNGRMCGYCVHMADKVMRD